MRKAFTLHPQALAIIDGLEQDGDDGALVSAWSSLGFAMLFDSTTVVASGRGDGVFYAERVDVAHVEPR